MTIHKSKGLEFEVVIVPELQAGSGKGKPKMLSWLERGLPPEDAAYGPDGSPRSPNFLSRPCNPKVLTAAPPSNGSTASTATVNSRKPAASSMSPPLARATNFISSPAPRSSATRTANGL